MPPPLVSLLVTLLHEVLLKSMVSVLIASLMPLVPVVSLVRIVSVVPVSPLVRRMAVVPLLLVLEKGVDCDLTRLWKRTCLSEEGGTLAV